MSPSQAGGLDSAEAIAPAQNLLAEGKGPGDVRMKEKAPVQLHRYSHNLPKLQ